MTKQKVIAVIPAHMASVRFPGKILHPFFGHPMIEHVRRRAMMSERLEDVYVATCDEEIAAVIRDYGGKVIMTGDHHRNGTTRVEEAVRNIECSHVILLQGDEPLLLPSFVDTMIDAIASQPDGDAWNGTGPIASPDELDRHSFVKCALSPEDRVLYCFRRNPSYADFDDQQQYIRKILGVIAFRKPFLEKLVTLSQSRIEKFEFIEQMRIIENGYNLVSVPFMDSLPSVNEPDEAEIIINYFNAHPEQQQLYERAFGKER